jgi:UMF1 family MFS transporter
MGVAVGYLGTIVVGLLIFLLRLPVESVFLLAAVLYAAFAVPIFLVVRERGDTAVPTVRDVTGSWRAVGDTVRRARDVPGLLRFIVARFFYTDAVNTVIVVMSVFAVEAIGLDAAEANLILLSLTVVAVLASFAWGLLVDRIGPKRTLALVLGSWCVGLALAAASLAMPSFSASLAVFLLAGVILGSGLGGVNVSDRVFLVRLAPRERIGEFFGLYGLAGKASALSGQLLYGAIVFALLDRIGDGAYAAGILSLFVTMVIGAWLLRAVPDMPGPPDDEREPRAAGPLPERLVPMAEPLEPRDAGAPSQCAR